MGIWPNSLFNSNHVYATVHYLIVFCLSNVYNLFVFCLYECAVSFILDIRNACLFCVAIANSRISNLLLKIELNLHDNDGSANSVARIWKFQVWDWLSDSCQGVLIFAFVQRSLKCACNLLVPIPFSEGLCECAVFETETPDTEAKPLISKSLVNVTCDDSGKTQCKDFCVALARASREQGGETLCAAVNHAVNLKVSTYLIKNTFFWTAILILLTSCMDFLAFFNKRVDKVMILCLSI